MRILQINSVCGYGSTGRIAIDLVNVLQQERHESCIAFGRGTSQKGFDTIRIGTNKDVMLHGVLSRIFDRHAFYSKLATKKFMKWIDDYRPDVIHLHNLHGYYINIEILFMYIRNKNIPVVWTMHDCWAFTGHCAYFEYVGCIQWKLGCSHCPQKREYPKSLLIDASKKNYVQKRELFCSIEKMYIVTPSHWLKDLVQQSFLNKFTVEVIHNCIDLNVFTVQASNIRKRYGLEHVKILLGVASVWNHRKGFSDFIKLAKELRDCYKIVLVGLSEKQLKVLPENVLGIKRTDSVTELAELYSAADIFINPTLEDNFPTTNLEALACGTPIITYPTGGSVECVDDTCGLVTKERNYKSILQALEDIERLNIKRDACVHKAQTYGKDGFREYINIYNKLIE